MIVLQVQLKSSLTNASVPFGEGKREQVAVDKHRFLEAWLTHISLEAKPHFVSGDETKGFIEMASLGTGVQRD